MSGSSPSAADHEDDATHLGTDIRIVDLGGADIVHTLTDKSHASIEYGVKKIMDAGALGVAINIDAFCPSIAPGTGTPSHGGFAYYDVLEILRGLSKGGEVVGIDLVEVAPVYDPTESTQIQAAQLLLNFLDFIFHSWRTGGAYPPPVENRWGDMPKVSRNRFEKYAAES